MSLDSRATRPPSSSTLTATGSAVLALKFLTMPFVNIDRSVQLPMKMPPTWLLATTAWVSSPLRPPTTNSRASLSRGDIDDRIAAGSPHAGLAGGISLADGEVAGAEFGRCEEWPQPAISAVTATNTASTRGNPIGPCCHEVQPATRPATSVATTSPSARLGSDESLRCTRRRQRRGRPVAGCSCDLRSHVDGAAGHQTAASRGRPAVIGAQPGRVRQPQLAQMRAEPGPVEVIPLSRRWLWLVAAVALALSFGSSPGQISPDTKLDLTANPLRFLARATNLWNSELPFGQAQNQAYGYLFPHGTFFLAGHLLGLPGWITQRLWWALLLTVGFWGLLRVAEALGIGSTTSRAVAAAAFALSPRVLTTIGAISSETLPIMMAPWVLLPTILALRSNDQSERSVRRLAGQAGVAVALMGAVNAIATLAGGLPAVIWWACHRPNRRWLRYAAWWLLALALAMTWGLVALILMARISPPFLDFIESSGVTTQWSSLVEVLRGTDSWTPFVAPDATAGASLVTGSVAILATCLAAAAGLAGLAMRDLPAQGRLVTMLLGGGGLRAA